jgi:5'-3' exonuclease
MKLVNILRATNPKKTVILAVDGPAPLAKLLLQRIRRKVRKGDGKTHIFLSF